MSTLWRAPGRYEQIYQDLLGKRARRAPSLRSAYRIAYMRGASVVRTTVYLHQETALALRQLAAVQGRSQAELIRDALENYTKRTVRPAPKGLGKYRSGEPDVARRAKDILSAAAKRANGADRGLGRYLRLI